MARRKNNIRFVAPLIAIMLFLWAMTWSIQIVAGWELKRAIALVVIFILGTVFWKIA